jgi:hypothetical protein
MTEREATAQHEARHLAMAISCKQYVVNAQVGGLVDARGIATYRRPLLQHPADERWRDGLVAIAPHLEEAQWPLGSTQDEAQATDAVEQTAERQKREPREVFDELLEDAKGIAAGAVHKRLVVALASALARQGRLEREDIAKVGEIVAKSFIEPSEGKEMQTPTHKTPLTPEHQHELDRFLVSLNKALTVETETSTPTTKSAAPIQIATFEC